MGPGKQRYMERRRLEAEARLDAAKAADLPHRERVHREREAEEMVALAMDCLASIADSLRDIADRMPRPAPNPPAEGRGGDGAPGDAPHEAHVAPEGDFGRGRG